MYNVPFNDAELQAFAVLIDTALKSGGLNIVGPAFLWQQKLVVAVQAAQLQEEIK